jgi:murein DD-endopeptidase MepM/ murein hydrolase activator NlpD
VTIPIKQIRLVSVLIFGLMFAALSSVYAQDGGQTSTQPNMTIHVVQRGESLFSIAQIYGVTVEDIAQANGIKDVTMIDVGQRLLIPNASPTAPGIPTEYVVQPDDSLLNLSLRYGMSPEDIAKRNNIVNPAQMYVGLKLALQEGANRQPTVKTGWLYYVQANDTLYRIAARYNLRLEKLQKINRLKRLSLLFPGQRLLIPAPQDGPSLADVMLPFSQITMLPAPAEQGRTFSLKLTTVTPVMLTGTFMDKPLLIHSDTNRTTHLIMDGIQSLAAPGIFPLILTAIDDQGIQTTYTRNIELADGGYLSESIQLEPGLEDLLNPALTQPESDLVLKTVSKVTDTRYITGPLGLPCPAAVTSQFGTRRSYNGGPFDQVHTGTDFAAAPDSPIFAPAGGVVVFAQNLNVRGNATIIDHGWGIYTGYWHQTEIKVKVGDVVQPGQIIGTVGKTGRVTGFHLHWELFVNGVQVDPLQWTRQSFP